ACPSSKPPSMSMSRPADWTAEKTSATSTPRPPPTTASDTAMPMNVVAVRSTGTVSVEAIARARPTPSMALTVPGIAPWLNGGATTRKTVTRTAASAMGTTTRARSTSAAQEPGDAVEELVGRDDELGDHPVPAEHDGHGHPDRLGHEAQGDLLDLGHRLEQGDGEADDQRGDEEWRGELGGQPEREGGDVDDVRGVHQ